MPQKLKVKIRDKWYTVEVQDLEADPVQVLVDGVLVEVALDSLPNLTQTEPDAPVREPNLPPEEPAAPVQEHSTPNPVPVQHVIRSPMPGVIMSVTVAEGDTVKAGDEICVLEAMKMQQSIKSDASGTVLNVRVIPGQQVQGGQEIAELG